MKMTDERLAELGAAREAASLRAIAGSLVND